MKRLSKASNSNKTRAAAAAHVAERFYEAEDEEMAAQKAKFAFLNEEDEAGADDVAEEEEEDDEAGHGLRRQPRKTGKLSSSKHGLNRHQKEEHPQQQQKRFECHKCGKGFQSSKAMCGHMACHSQKDKGSSNVVAKQKPLLVDSHSDTESGEKNQRRRSSRRRYRKHDSVSGWKAKVDVFSNCSSEASGIEQEQEEGAICLMMLSRDSANWGGLNSFGDSSDNNSVVLESRSMSTKLAKKNGLRSTGYGVDADKKKCGTKKVKTLGDFESGYVRNEAKNVELDPKMRNLKRDKVVEGSKAEPHLSLKKLKRALDGEERYSQIERPKMDSYLMKRAVNESYEYSSAEMCRRFEQRAPIHSHRDFNSYEVANKASLTASPLHGETDGYPDMRKGKGILEHNSANVTDNQKTRKYECSTCSKVCRSAQALGCHRLQHLHERPRKINRCDGFATMLERNRTQVHDSIDLNLPAPTDDDEASESIGSYGRFHTVDRS